MERARCCSYFMALSLDRRDRFAEILVSCLDCSREGETSKQTIFNQTPISFYESMYRIPHCKQWTRQAAIVALAER